MQPTGLAARDSTRTEAGLPLYGHELEGHFGISPAGARFAAYVKLHKPFFIGRKPYLEAEKGRTMEVARFRMNDRGVRMPKTGDPVVNKKGQAIGWVTSAAVDVDGIILGLAYVGSRYAKPGDEIGIFNLPGRSRWWRRPTRPTWPPATRWRCPTRPPCSRASRTRPSARTGGDTATPVAAAAAPAGE